MFLAGDESTAYHFRVIGFLCLPIPQLPLIEEKFSSIRIDTHFWGEIDWKSLPSSEEKINNYFKFLDIFLDNNNMSYNAIIYGSQQAIDIKNYFGGMKKKEYVKFMYTQIRCICKMIQKENLKRTNQLADKVYILGDEIDGYGSEWKETHERLLKDSQVILPIHHCGPCKSHLCSAIQLSDLITGAVATRKNNKILNVWQKRFIEYLERKIGYQISQDIPAPEWGRYKVNTWVCNPSGYHKNDGKLW